MAALNVVTIPPTYHKQIEDGLKTNSDFECEIFGAKIQIVLTDTYPAIATVKYVSNNRNHARTTSRNLQSVLSAIEHLFQSDSLRLTKPCRQYLIVRYDDEDHWTDAEIATEEDVARALINYSYVNPREESFHNHATNVTLFTYQTASKDSLLKIYCFEKTEPVPISWRIVHVNGTSVLLFIKDGAAIDYYTLYDLSCFIDMDNEY